MNNNHTQKVKYCVSIRRRILQIVHFQIPEKLAPKVSYEFSNL